MPLRKPQPAGTAAGSERTPRHETLSGTTPAADSLELLEVDLDDIGGGGW